MKNKTETTQDTPKFRTQYNSKECPRGYETPKGVSQFVPGQCYTIKEILERFTLGMAPPVYHPGAFDENPDFESWDETQAPDFDLADFTQLSAELEEKQKQSTRKKPVANSEIQSSDRNAVKVSNLDEATATG